MTSQCMPDNYIYSLLSIQHTLTFIISWITNRFKECGGCVGSKESNDCGICTNCQDKPKFGGPSRKKLCEQRCKHYVMMICFFFKYHFAICDTGNKVKATVLSPTLNTSTLPKPYPSASKQVLKCLLENLSNYAGQLLAPPGVHVSCTSSSITTDVSNRSMAKRFYCLQRT